MPICQQEDLSKLSMKTVKKVTKTTTRKQLSDTDNLLLWIKAGGRCEFPGCNRVLYEDQLTVEPLNLAEKAHIVANSKNGPRGDEKQSPLLAKDISNFMLLCKDCHKRIDNSPENYPREDLEHYKRMHEERIRIVTGIEQDKRTEAIIFTAPIGGENFKVDYNEVRYAILQNGRYPSNGNDYTDLSISTEKEDSDDKFWERADDDLISGFARKLSSLSKHNQVNHFSVFALAPIPLLIRLGTLLGEKTPCEVHHAFHRQRMAGNRWCWGGIDDELGFKIKYRKYGKGNMLAINLSLSGQIDDGQITEVLGNDVQIWTLTCRTPKYDLIESKPQIEAFKAIFRELLSKINESNNDNQEVNLFPAIPNSVAVELGRLIPSKISSKISIYDKNIKRLPVFFKTITLNAQ